MFRSTIKINDKDITLKFGMWTLEQFAEMGESIETLLPVLGKNPFKYYPLVLHFGACEASGRKLDAHDYNTFYDWVEEMGVMSKEVDSIMQIFVDSVMKHFPREAQDIYAKAKEDANKAKNKVKPKKK